jgi:hypothetical protein
VARGAELPGAARLLVFDDISEIVSAQRAQAWGEVARRLAHEIKNPLTPIQLSAERLEMKLARQGGEAPEQAMLVKSVKTIVDQVDAMKRLVNEFRDYARLPAAELKPVDSTRWWQDVLQLYHAENLPIVLPLGTRRALPADPGDAQQLRQVIHNLLQNAQDAAEAAARPTGRRGRGVMRTQWIRFGPARAPGGAGQRPGLCRKHPEARLRALRHHEDKRHRPGPRRGQEDRRRARRAHRADQPSCRRDCGRGPSLVIIRAGIEPRAAAAEDSKSSTA